MPIVSTAKMTSRQFLELGEDPPGVRLELVGGEVAVSPSPVPDHSYVLIELARIMGTHIKSKKLGRAYLDVDTIFGPLDVRRPDLLYFAQDRLHLVGRKAMEGPPDLCVEVLSPSSVEIDRVDKFAQYQNAGVAYYWIIDPANRTLEAFGLTNGRYELAERGEGDQVVRVPPFADLDLPLSELWHPE